MSCLTAIEKEELCFHIKKLIEEKKAQLPALIESSKPVAPDVSLGRLTRMEAIADKEMAKAQLDRLNSELSALAQALLQLEQDQAYGFCEECEERISFNRLKSLPLATFCIDCAR